VFKLNLTRSILIETPNFARVMKRRNRCARDLERLPFARALVIDSPIFFLLFRRKQASNVSQAESSGNQDSREAN
jgi:hypothetical protein